MDRTKLIFLIGMPAAGKTYWAAQIAKKYALDFIDLDIFIAEQERASLSALFATYGENGFREREHKYLNKIIESAADTTIVACGGGTPCFDNNMQMMKENGIVVYIQTDIPQILEHLAGSTEVRPLLRGRTDMTQYLDGLYEKRRAYYEQAHHILHSANISLATFTEIVSHV